MAVEFDDALPADVLERLEHEDGLLESLGAYERREVVVELRFDLRAEVEELELLEAAEVRDGHAGVHQCHALVLEQLGVHAPEIRTLEAAEDEADGVAAGGQEHLAARLVRLGFDGGADVVRQLLGFDVVRDVVQAFGQPVVDLAPLRHGGDLEAVAGDPVDVVLRPEELADAQRALHLAGGQFADLGVGVAETAVAEHRMPVEAACGRVHAHAGGVEDLLDFTKLVVDGAFRIEIVFEMLGIPRDEVVVVKRGQLDKAGLAGFGDELRDFEGVEAVHDGAAKGIG